MRIERFVRAARALLAMQAAVALAALVLAGWAVFAVRDLATERDRLRDEVAQLRRDRPAGDAAAATVPTTAGGIPASPLDSEVRPPAIMPVLIPILADAPIVPSPDADAPLPAGPPAPGTGVPADCAEADPARCRPGRWTTRTPPAQAPAPPVRIAPPAEPPKG